MDKCTEITLVFLDFYPDKVFEYMHMVIYK